MKPTIAVDIIGRDKTAGGFKGAERAAAGFARKTTAIQDSGVAKIARSAAALTRIRDAAGAADLAGRGISNIGRVSVGAAENVARLGAGLTGMGGVATRAFGAVAAGAGLAVTSIGAVVTALGIAGVAAYELGKKWAKTGSEVGRTARDLGISNADLQARRAAGERYGVTPEGTDAAVGGLADTLYDAKAGGNNLALGVLGQIGVKLKTGANGQTDVGAAYDDIADAIARQKDPAVQRKLAGIFGMSSALPALRQGSATLKAAGADYLGSGSAYSDAEIGEASETSRKATRLEQHLRKLEKTAGGVAAKETAFVADNGVSLIRDGKLDPSGAALAQGAKDAATSLIDGARKAGLAFGAALNSSALTSAAGGGSGLGGRGGIGRHDAKASEAAGFFMSKGWTRAQAAGIVANLSRESAFDHQATGDGGKAYGVAQWHPDRQAAFKAWSGKDIRRSSLQDQLAFVHHEMTSGSEQTAGQTLRRAGTAAEAGAVVSRHYERPADREGEASARARLAEKVEVTINLKGAPAGTTSRVAGAKNTEVSMNVVRSLEGPGGLR